MNPDAHRSLSLLVFVLGAAGLVWCLAVIPPGGMGRHGSILIAPAALLILGAAGGLASKS